MAHRQCEDCGRHMGPYEPRTRVEGRMLCPACKASPRGGMVSKSANVDENGWYTKPRQWQERSESECVKGGGHGPWSSSGTCMNCGYNAGDQPDDEDLINDVFKGPEYKDADFLLDQQSTGPTKHSKKKGLPRTQKCSYCDDRATKRLLWAEGMAYIPACDAHEKDARHQIEVTNKDEVVGVKPIEKASTRSEGGYAVRKTAHDSGDGLTVFHCPFVAAGRY